MTAPPAEAPTRQQSRELAELFADAGATIVLLYGSVARGTATTASDIDMIAVFDDIDYSQRTSIHDKLTTLAAQATNAEVSIRVTDRPEWRHRSEKMSTTFEHHIAPGAIVVHSEPPRAAVCWGKQIGQPATRHDEMASCLKHANRSLARLANSIVADAEETDPANGQELRDIWREHRFETLNKGAFMVATTCLKALRHCHDLPHLPTHDVAAHIDSLPAPHKDHISEYFTGDAAQTINLWGSRDGFPTTEGPHPDLADNPAHTAALLNGACRLAQHTAHIAAAHAATRGPSQVALTLLDRINANRDTQPDLACTPPRPATNLNNTLS